MSEKEEHVSRAELEEFAGAIREALCEIKKDVEAVRSESQEPKEVAIYSCSEEGCTYKTDDIGDFVEHTVDERLKKMEEERKKLQEQKPKIAHATIEEFLECPECFPNIEKAFLDRGWTKPEPKPKKELF